MSELSEILSRVPSMEDAEMKAKPRWLAWISEAIGLLAPFSGIGIGRPLGLLEALREDMLKQLEAPHARF